MSERRGSLWRRRRCKDAEAEVEYRAAALEERGSPGFFKSTGGRDANPPSRCLMHVCELAPPILIKSAVHARTHAHTHTHTHTHIHTHTHTHDPTNPSPPVGELGGSGGVTQPTQGFAQLIWVLF